MWQECSTMRHLSVSAWVPGWFVEAIQMSCLLSFFFFFLLFIWWHLVSFIMGVNWRMQIKMLRQLLSQMCIVASTSVSWWCWLGDDGKSEVNVLFQSAFSEKNISFRCQKFLQRCFWYSCSFWKVWFKESEWEWSGNNKKRAVPASSYSQMSMNPPQQVEPWSAWDGII